MGPNCTCVVSTLRCACSVGSRDAARRRSILQTVRARVRMRRSCRWSSKTCRSKMRNWRLGDYWHYFLEQFSDVACEYWICSWICLWYATFELHACEVLMCFYNLFVLRCVLEQKHPPEPGHPWRTGSHLRASCPASPPAEPQTAAGNNCPTTIWASPTHAAEPRAPQRGANQTHRCSSSLRRRHSCLFQRQSSKRSFKAFAKQRQERFQHVRWL